MVILTRGNREQNTAGHKYLSGGPSRITSKRGSTSLEVFQGVAFKDHRDLRRSLSLQRHRSVIEFEQSILLDSV